MVDSLMADLGIDGGKLANMGGLVRDARDIQCIAQSRARSRDGGDLGTGGGGDHGGASSEGGGDQPPASSGGSRRRSSPRTKK